MGDLDPATRIGTVRLDVGDLDRAQAFYERVLGLESVDRSDGLVRMGAGPTTLVELAAHPGAPPRPPGTTGLFHLAVLVPDRMQLAVALRRVAEGGWRLSGASDHLVSEALYLSDVERNGIEIYRDRPRSEWRYHGEELEMDTLALDLQALLAEPAPAEGQPAGMAPGTSIGHVHLQVSDLREAESFYAGVLGFDVTVRSYPGALFVSAGGYHHHIGLNTWATEGAPPPPPGSLGLAWFEVLLGANDDLDRVGERLGGAGIEPDSVDGGLLACDPSGNRVLLRVG